jgi:hypothetical protein
MATMIETDLKEILGKFKQEFSKLNQRLDRIEGDLTSLKVSQAEIKGEMETFKAEVKGEFSTLKNELAFNQRRCQRIEKFSTIADMGINYHCHWSHYHRRCKIRFFP